MIDLLNKYAIKITKLSLEMQDIANGAVVDPDTGNILKDKSGNTIFYKDSQGHKNRREKSK